MSTETEASSSLYTDSPNARSYSAARSRAHTRVACTTCKAAKVRCEGARPCRYCVKHQLSDQCVDAVQKKRGPKPKTIKITGLTFDLSRSSKTAPASVSARRSPPTSKRFASTSASTTASDAHVADSHQGEVSRPVPGASTTVSPPTAVGSPLSRHAAPPGYHMDHSGLAVPMGAYAALPPTPPSQIPLYPMGALPYPGMPFSMPMGLSSPAASSSHQRGEGTKAEAFGMPFPPSPTLFLNGMHVPMGMSLSSMAAMTGGDKQSLSPSFAVPPYPMLYGTPPMAAAGGRFMFDMPMTPTFAATQSAYGLGGFCYYPQPPMTALPASVVSLLPPTAPSTSGSSTPLSAGDGTATSSTSGRRLSVASMDSGLSKDSTPNTRASKPIVSPRAMVSPRTAASPRTAVSPAHSSHLIGQDVPFPAPNSPIFDAVEGLTSMGSSLGRRRSHSMSEAASSTTDEPMPAATTAAPSTAPSSASSSAPSASSAPAGSSENEEAEASDKGSLLASRPIGSSSSAFGRPQKRIRS